MKRFFSVFLFLSLIFKVQSQDSIKVSSDDLSSLLSKRAGSHLPENAIFSSTDTVVGAVNKSFGTVVQTKLSKLNNALLTATKFNSGNITARIIKDSSIYYEWENGFFIKKRSPLTFYNGENLILPDKFKQPVLLPDLYYTANFTQREKDSIMIVHGGICIYYDFDGQTVTNTAWNFSGDIIAAPSSVSTDTAAMDFIVQFGQEAYQPFNIVVTRDSALYFLAKIGRRIRVIFTPTYQWYCGSTTPCAGGVSYVGTLYWNDDTPSWAFDAIASTRGKAIVGAHEAAHQFGLQHYDTNGFGSGEAGVVPLLNANSNLYSHNMTLLWKGVNVVGEQQDDAKTIATLQGNAFWYGHRLGDIGTTFNTSGYISRNQNAYSFIGLSDSDYYKITIDTIRTVTITVSPKSNGSNSVSSTNADAVFDAAIDLYDESHNLITSSNNPTTLNASLTQSLPAGTYYVKVRADRSNPNVPSGYEFMGHYWISYTY